RRHEVVDHVFFEAVCEIPYIKRNIENIGDATSVTGVLLRTAAPRSGAQRAWRGRQRQVYADNIVTGIDHPRSGDRRVDAAAHCDEHSHCSAAPALARAACRARSTPA